MTKPWTQICLVGAMALMSIASAQAQPPDCQVRPTCPTCPPHFFFQFPKGVYGNSKTPGVPCGSQGSCPPQGPYFGYYPTCWHQWPQGWQPGPIKPAEPLPEGCVYELLPPVNPLLNSPAAAAPKTPAPAVVNPPVPPAPMPPAPADPAPAVPNLPGPSAQGTPAPATRKLPAATSRAAPAPAVVKSPAREADRPRSLSPAPQPATKAVAAPAAPAPTRLMPQFPVPLEEDFTPPPTKPAATARAKSAPVQGEYELVRPVQPRESAPLPQPVVAADKMSPKAADKLWVKVPQWAPAKTLDDESSTKISEKMPAKASDKLTVKAPNKLPENADEQRPSEGSPRLLPADQSWGQANNGATPEWAVPDEVKRSRSATTRQSAGTPQRTIASSPEPIVPSTLGSGLSTHRPKAGIISPAPSAEIGPALPAAPTPALASRQTEARMDPAPIRRPMISQKRTARPADVSADVPDVRIDEQPVEVLETSETAAPSIGKSQEPTWQQPTVTMAEEPTVRRSYEPIGLARRSELGRLEISPEGSRLRPRNQDAVVRPRETKLRPRVEDVEPSDANRSNPLRTDDATESPVPKYEPVSKYEPARKNEPARRYEPASASESENKNPLRGSSPAMSSDQPNAGQPASAQSGPSPLHSATVLRRR